MASSKKTRKIIIFSLIGLAFYAVLPPTKPKELAITFAMFQIGLLAFLINYTHVVTLGGLK